MDREGRSYTQDTLRALIASGLDPASLVFVTGADAFRDIPAWKGYPQVLDLCHFAVVARPGTAVEGLRTALPALASRMKLPHEQVVGGTVIFLVDAPTRPVSSTDVRRAVAEGAPTDQLVGQAVAGYIAKHRLYLPAAR
jgi:nicotinate-nucleotide adenylyltransferase